MRQEDGSILLTTIILLALMTAIGVSVLNTSMISERQVGLTSARLGLEYQAEDGLEKAMLRLQKIFRGTDSMSPPLDLTTNLLTLCTPNTLAPPAALCTTKDPACLSLDPGTDATRDVPNENVICDFLGGAYPGGRVIVVRKDDMTDASGIYAQFLVNVVASNPAQRRRTLQALVIGRYSPSIQAPPDPVIDVAFRHWLSN